MKKRFSLFILAALIASTPVLQAAEIEPAGTPLRKLQRGFLNIVLSPFELSHELHKEKREDIFPPSWFRGAGRGMAFMAGRAIVGVVEMGTFFIPLPADYEPILEPEFAWDHLEEKPEAPPEDARVSKPSAETAEPDREAVMAQAAQKFELTEAGFDPELAEKLELS